MHTIQGGGHVMRMQDRTVGASRDSAEVGLGDRDGDTNRTGMNVSMLQKKVYR